MSNLSEVFFALDSILKSKEFSLKIIEGEIIFQWFDPLFLALLRYKDALLFLVIEKGWLIN